MDRFNDLNRNNPNLTQEQIGADNSLKSKFNNRDNLLLKEIQKEIKIESVRNILFKVFAWIGFLVFVTLNAFWILKKLEIIKFNIIAEFGSSGFWLIFFVVFVPGFVFFFTLLIYAQLTSYRFNQEKKFHFENSEDIDLRRVPNFVVEKYKRISGALIVVNWLAIVSYFLAGIILAFLLVVKNKGSFTIWELKINLVNGQSFPSYNWEIIWTSVYLGIIFVFQIVTIIIAARGKARLMSLFDLRNRINFDEINSYKKKVHIFCFCIFVLPIFLTIIFFLLIKRLRKGKK